MIHPASITRRASIVLACAALFTACGGGDEGPFVDEKEPSPSGLSATMTVASATAAVLNGAYGSGDVLLNNVTKVNPIGGDPETCRFRFGGLSQVGSDRRMDGDIRYIPGSAELRTTFVSIDTVEFRLEGSEGATVDRANNRVVYAGALLQSTQGTGAVIRVSGAIPMRGDRPEGC
jgi:hypothetical protein